MTTLASSPRDFHNTLADVDEQQTYRAADADQPTHIGAQDSGAYPADTQHIEMAAFEKGRMQGEIEAIRRLEAESALHAPKTFANETTTVQTALAQPTVVEINQLTRPQWAAAIFGELCGAAYIVLMSVWLDRYREGGVSWDDANDSGSKSMFNVHVLTGFVGLWFASQAYITYRLLPMRTPPMINKLWYVLCHAAALACFGVSIAAALKATPTAMAWSMHSWTAFLAVAVYAAHALYSSMKVMLHHHGIPADQWNESRDRQFSTTPEQRRDHTTLNQDTLYVAGPGVWKRDQHVAAVQGADPQWSETSAIHSHEFFLVPRAKWGVVSMLGLAASVLIGLGEWQVLLAVDGRMTWPQSDPAVSTQNGAMGLRSEEATLIGCIGLLTLASALSLAYASLPPRTTITKQHSTVVDRRTSVSIGDTAPNTRNEYADVV